MYPFQLFFEKYYISSCLNRLELFSSSEWLILNLFHKISFQQAKPNMKRNFGVMMQAWEFLFCFIHSHGNIAIEFYWAVLCCVKLHLLFLDASTIPVRTSNSLDGMSFVCVSSFALFCSCTLHVTIKLAWHITPLRYI